MDPSPAPAYRREMSFHLRAQYQHPPADGDDYSTRLHDLTPLAPDDETRATGQDLQADHSAIDSFLEPVEKPAWLKPHRRHRRD